jgi:hypothetical protein
MKTLESAIVVDEKGKFRQYNGYMTGKPIRYKNYETLKDAYHAGEAILVREHTNYDIKILYVVGTETWSPRRTTYEDLFIATILLSVVIFLLVWFFNIVPS